MITNIPTRFFLLPFEEAQGRNSFSFLVFHIVPQNRYLSMKVLPDEGGSKFEAHQSPLAAVSMSVNYHSTLMMAAVSLPPLLSCLPNPIVFNKMFENLNAL